LEDLRAFLDARFDELLDLLQLRFRVDGADIGVLVERVAEPERAEAELQLLQQRLRDRLLH
jgi:hypothetical protein